MHFEQRDESAVEDGEADETSNITDDSGFWPGLQKLMLGLGWAVAIEADINTHKFNPLREPHAFSEAKRQILQAAHLKDAFNVIQGDLE